MTKKFKSKFFRVATEGATTDGRVISASWIQQMADTFDSKKYGARVWMEHIRGILPDSPFKAYGDVTAVEARKGDDGKLALYAQIDPTEELVKINKSRQKIYTSIEINPDFSDSGKAYLIGLGITDSPASLGTEMLQFAQLHPDASPLTARKSDKGNLFSVCTEVDFEFDEVVDAINFSDRIKSALGLFKEKAVKIDGQLGELLGAVEEVANHSAELEATVGAMSKEIDGYKGLDQRFKDLKKQFDDFKEQIESTDADASGRPPASGGDGQIQADC